MHDKRNVRTMIMDDEILGEDDDLEGAVLPLEDEEEDEDAIDEDEESADDAAI